MHKVEHSDKMTQKTFNKIVRMKRPEKKDIKAPWTQSSQCINDVHHQQLLDQQFRNWRLIHKGVIFMIFSSCIQKCLRLCLFSMILDAYSVDYDLIALIMSFEIIDFIIGLRWKAESRKSARSSAIIHSVQRSANTSPPTTLSSYHR